MFYPAPKESESFVPLSSVLKKPPVPSPIAYPDWPVVGTTEFGDTNKPISRLQRFMSPSKLFSRTKEGKPSSAKDAQHDSMRFGHLFGSTAADSQTSRGGHHQRASLPAMQKPLPGHPLGVSNVTPPQQDDQYFNMAPGGPAASQAVSEINPELTPRQVSRKMNDDH